MPESERYIKGPMLVVISAPSGAGKTSICRELVSRHANINMSISATTRPRARGERNGRDYYFLDKKDFETKIKEGWFVEYARVFDHYYGTPQMEVDKNISRGNVILFDIDVQGGETIMGTYPDAVTIFIMPPSMDELKHRLKLRKRDTQEEINKRLGHALREIEYRTKYDYTVVNKDLEQAISRMESILEAESLRSGRFKAKEFK